MQNIYMQYIYAKHIFTKQVLFKRFAHDESWNFEDILNKKINAHGFMQIHDFSSFLADFNYLFFSKLCKFFCQKWINAY